MQFERKILDNGVIEYMINGDFTIFFLNNIKSDIEKDIASGKNLRCAPIVAKEN